jgi:hypothetical protein
VHFMNGCIYNASAVSNCGSEFSSTTLRIVAFNRRKSSKWLQGIMGPELTGRNGIWCRDNLVLDEQFPLKTFVSE